MARRTGASVTGQFRGRVGPVVFSSWINIDTVAIRPKRGKSRKKQTELQAEQSELFTRVNYLISPIRPLLTISFQMDRKKPGLPYSAAVSEIMINGVITYEGHRYLDFSQIKLSKSVHRTEQLWNPAVKVETGRKITVSWELNDFSKKCTRTDDEVKIAYCSNYDPMFNLIPKRTERKDLSITFNTNRRTVGKEIFIYAVVISADGKLVAESDYLGSITILG